MREEIQSLRNYTIKVFYDGAAMGVMLSTGMAGVVDGLSDGTFDHPYLTGIPFIISFGIASYLNYKYGEDKGLNYLERELEGKSKTLNF